MDPSLAQEQQKENQKQHEQQRAATASLFTNRAPKAALPSTPMAPLASSTAAATRPRWQKLLYIRQDYPDNYVDHSFLKQMKKNVNVRQLRYWTVVCESFCVSQQLSVTMVFVAAFVHLLVDQLDPIWLMVGSCGVTSVMYLVWVYLSVRMARGSSVSRETSALKTISSVILFFTMLLGLTPILKTLTKDTSSDSIWFMTIVMFLANILFHDYGTTTSTHARFPDSLSINAAMFASVLLASRLASNLSVFGLMLLAVELFALFPILRRSLRAWFHSSAISDGILSATLVCIAISLLWPLSHVACTFYVVCMAFVTFFCPYLLVSIQKYKSEIRGPWDEAVLGGSQKI